MSRAPRPGIRRRHKDFAHHAPGPTTRWSNRKAPRRNLREPILDRKAVLASLQNWLDAVMPVTALNLSYKIHTDSAPSAAPIANASKSPVPGGSFIAATAKAALPGPVAPEEFEKPEIVVVFDGPDKELLLEHGAELLLALEYLAVRSLRLEPPFFDRIRFDSGDFRALPASPGIDALRESCRSARPRNQAAVPPESHGRARTTHRTSRAKRHRGHSHFQRRHRRRTPGCNHAGRHKKIIFAYARKVPVARASCLCAFSAVFECELNLKRDRNRAASMNYLLALLLFRPLVAAFNSSSHEISSFVSPARTNNSGRFRRVFASAARRRHRRISS